MTTGGGELKGIVQRNVALQCRWVTRCASSGNCKASARTIWRSAPAFRRPRSRRSRTIAFDLVSSEQRFWRGRSSVTPAFWFSQAGCCQPEQRHNTRWSRRREERYDLPRRGSARAVGWATLEPASSWRVQLDCFAEGTPMGRLSTLLELADSHESSAVRRSAIVALR